MLTDLPTTALSNGLHTLHLRFKDDTGQWSGVLSQFFIKPPPSQGGDRQIVAYQYWFDEASAEEATTAINPEPEVDLLIDIPTPGLDVGTHTLHLRFRDDKGIWSSVTTDNFSVPANTEATPIAHNSMGLLVYSDETVGTPKYKIFNDSTVLHI